MHKKKVLLIILDGVGYNPENKIGNVLFSDAHLPNLRTWLKANPWSILQASGSEVGLPEGQMGNSEVGHLNIGTGRVIWSSLAKIDHDIKDGSFEHNKAIIDLCTYARSHPKNKIHLVGLVSSGGVHSSFQHLLEIIKILYIKKIPVVLHCISDGRDVGVNDFSKDLCQLCKLLETYQNTTIGSISGRYYAMDRDKKWDRIEKAYQAICGKGDVSFVDPQQYIAKQYGQKITDEFIVPAWNASVDKQKIALQENDGVFFFNFRPDRARQMCHMFKQTNGYYDYQNHDQINNLYLVTMTKYEGIVCNDIVYHEQNIQNCLGQVIEKNNLKQLRIAETEKYAHVTFFFDGGKEIDFANEQKILIPSPKVATYDLAPEMSANEITKNLLQTLGNFDLTVCNFANGDMVGHTGNMNATKKAMETVDRCLGEIWQEAKKKNITVFLTADHGNCDLMINPTTMQPITTHSLAPVFFLSSDNDLKLKNGCLANIAPTILQYMGITIPSEMLQETLIKH